MKTIGYARTTINDSDLNAQIAALSDYGCDRIYHEVFDVSAGKRIVTKLESVLHNLDKTDTLVICQLHHLGKSTRQLTDLIQLFKEKEVHLVSLKEEIDTRHPAGDLYFKSMTALAKMECDLIKERTLVGLNKARKEGKVGGRPKTNPKTIKKIRKLYYEKKETIQLISSKCGISIGTCYKYINLSDEDVDRLYTNS